MKKILGIMAIGMGLVFGPVANAQPKPVKLTYASYYGENYTVSRTDIWFMNEIEKRTKGKVTFERYHNSTLLKAPDIYPGLTRGAVDVASGTPGAYNRNQYRLSNISLPYITADAYAVSMALTDLYKSSAAFRDEYERQNAKVLYFLAWGENSFYMGKKPVTSAGDFKGQRVRAVQAVAEAVQAMGGTTVAITWNEAVEGLSRGVVDIAGSIPFDSGVFGGIYQQAKFGTNGGDLGIFAFATISMSKKRFDSFDPETQKIIMQVASEAPAKYMEFLEESYTDVVDRLCKATEKGDLVINMFSKEESEKAKKIANAVIQPNFVKWSGETVKTDTQAFLNQYIDLVRKYEAQSKWKDGYQRLVERKCAK